LLTPDELERYDRQMLVKGVGRAGQERLKATRIVIAGAGGLGSSAALHLVAAGIGTVRLIDNDSVTLSNLHRQILHWTPDIDSRKVFSAKEKLARVNPLATVEAVDARITEDSASDLVSGFDLIVDALDSLDTRLILNKTAIGQGMPLFHGAVRSFEGRIMTVIPGETACLRCIYRGVRDEERTPVAGVTPAVIGALQATEVLKYILGIGRLLTGRLLIYDGLNLHFTEFDVQRDPECPHCGVIKREGER
jgi:adenylyltransferase/sulfurtransferase